MMFNLILGFALARGAWNGLRGRTKLLRSGGLGTFAYGDGRHDDTAFIQREIDRAPEVILHIPRGTFNVSRPIELTNLGLHGAGRATAIKWDV